MRGVSRNTIDEYQPGGEELDLGGVWQALWRARKWIMGLTALAFAGSVAFVMLVKPRYTAEAKALIENQESYFTRPERTASEAGATAPDAEAVTSQAQLVTSRDLAREAIRSLELKGNPEFDPAAGGAGFLSRMLSLISLQRDDRLRQPEDRIFEAYYDALYVFPIVKSRVLQIEFSSRDPDLAARAANLIADLYVGLQANAKRANAKVAAASLASLIGDLRARVADAERKAEEFRAANGLLPGANNLSMNGQQLAEINAQLTLARAAQADAQAKSRMIRDMLRQGRIGEVPDVANNELIRRLSEQRATLRGQIALEGRTLLPGHPRFKELNAQLAELDGNIRSAADKAARTLENDARIAGTRFDNLQAALDQQKKTVGGASVDEARAKELDREARLLKEQLETSTAKYQEALARQAAESTPSDARIISRAMAPQLPAFPKKAPIVVFATLAAFILSAGAVLASELLSGRAYVNLAHAPGPRVEPELVATSGEAQGYARSIGAAIIDSGEAPIEGPASEAVVEVAQTIAHRPRAEGALRLLVTGSRANAEAVETAVALGRALVCGQSTVLVELSGRSGSAGAGPAGLTDLLSGRANFENAIHRDRGSKLHLLPFGRGGQAIAEGLDVVIDALRHAYANVILLSPSLSKGADVFLLAPEVDVVVLVCPHGSSDDENAAAVLELQRAGAEEVLVVVDAEAPVDPAAAETKQAA